VGVSELSDDSLVHAEHLGLALIQRSRGSALEYKWTRGVDGNWPAFSHEGSRARLDGCRDPLRVTVRPVNAAMDPGSEFSPSRSLGEQHG
jgi:hypothetical protein